MLKPGDKLDSSMGNPVTISKLLGTGGQGTVHEARLADGGKVAVKWFHPASQRRELRESITALVEEKAPSAHFLWPDDIVTKGHEFGYVMRLRPPSFVGLPMVLGRKVGIRFSELVQAASHTVSAFKALQAKGLFYCDISDGNLFIDPKTGEVLICDNDNVASSRAKPHVLGTARFMAPEIVRQERKPSPLTDSFSMAVLLFLLLMNDHPLQGKAEARIHVFDEAAMRRIYGTHPVFIFDPSDSSNRPVPGVHLNAPVFWKLYPEVLRTVFVRVFTEGINDPGRRPSFGEWQSALTAVADAMVECASCKGQNFVCVTRPHEIACWRCRQRFRPPVRLVIGRSRLIVLNRTTKLYAHHLTKIGDPAAGGPACAEVAQHPTKSILGLRNTSHTQWLAQVPGKAHQAVATGQSVSLIPGTKIDFGEVEGTIEA
ncbi:protein kinase domain-containing protein [Solwaraspora sp. WMMB762]|uniref:protein kinase domain-containing protein n=1 Tax=Solwaraspora sp. WMMB762 TaxID=3404120 RepID=UPI003B952C53